MQGRLLGPYRIGPELGSGGMATVYLGIVEEEAPGLHLGEKVAIKVVHSHLITTPGFYDRFLREIEVGKSIRHENVVRTFDAMTSRDNGHEENYMVMEYVEGQTLRGLIGELGWAPEDLCRHIGREIARALCAIHSAGIIHRDLKPENVLITREDVVKVMDLGVARLQDEALKLSQTGQFVGSVMYAAPEQFRGGSSGLDGRVDLYALGMTLYELATGINPFRDDNFAAVVRRQLTEDAKPLSEANPQVSPFFEEVVKNLMKKDPGDRFPSAAVFLDTFTGGEESLWWRRRSGEIREETKKPLRRIRIPRDTTLYGREKEVRTLRGIWDRVKAGDGQVLLVEGEAGIGKTRLVDEFAAQLEQKGEDFHYLFGSYPPGGAATASGAFNTAYREHFGTEGIEDRLREHLSQTPALVPAFGAFLRGMPPPHGEEPLTKDSIQTVFVHTTRGLATEKPVIVLIDDLHFAPEEGRALFAALSLALRGHRILLVGTARPELDETWKLEVAKGEDATRLEVGRLGRADLERLLREALKSRRLSEELGAKIEQKTDGNPFFVFEVIRGLREGRFVAEQEDGTWAATRVIGEIQIPSTVRDLVGARISDLSESDRDLLDVAACCGFEFDPVLVGEALGMGRIPTLKRLGHLERDNRLVRSAGRRYMFDHHQVQEVLYEGLSELLREEYHAALGETLEEMTGAHDKAPEELDGALAIDLSEHFLKGQRGDRARPYVMPALTYLSQFYRNDHAVSLAGQALAVPGLLEGAERVAVLLHQSGPLHFLGRREEEGKALREAIRLAEQLGDHDATARAERLLGVHHWVQSENEPAREHLNRAIELARQAGNRAGEASAIGSLGNVLLRQGQYDEAEARYIEQMEIAREIGDRKEEGRATCTLGIIAFRLGRHDAAREHYENYLEISRAIGDRKGEANAAANLGIMSHALFRADEASRWVEMQLEIAREIGDRRAEGMASGSLGLVLKDLHRYEDSRERAERHREIARETGDRRGEGIATGNIGLILKKLGRFEDARICHEKHLEIAREIGDGRGELSASLSLANALEALGRLGEARGHYRTVVDNARKLGDPGSEMMGLVNLGLIGAVLGDVVAARRQLEAAFTLGAKLGAGEVEAAAIGGLAGVAAIEGDVEAERALLSQALLRHEKAGSEESIVEALIGLGRLDRNAGRNDEAKARFDRAVAVARKTKEPAALVRSLVWLASVSFDGGPEAKRALEKHENRLEARVRMEAHYCLYLSSDDRRSLGEAHRDLMNLVREAPEEWREAMTTKVPLHREILAAWKE